MSSQGVMSSKAVSNNPGFVLLKDNNRTVISRSEPEINSRVCLCALQGPRHNTRCCFSIQLFIFLLIFCLENPKKGSGPTNLWTEASLASLSAISFPLNPICPGTQHNPTACKVEISFNAFWHFRTKGAVWQPEAHLSGLFWVSVSWTQAT